MNRVIESMFGLGDNIYQRAFIRNLGPCYLSTVWPELYEDLPNVQFLPPTRTSLRTQAKNVKRQQGRQYAKEDRHLRMAMRNRTRPFYGQQGIIPGMARCFRVQPGPFDLPDFSEYAPKIEGRYAVVRPVTVRREWPAQSRNPLPEYVNLVAGRLREEGYTVVSVADLQEGHEWAVDGLPPSDIQYHHGELDVRQLLGLVQGAHAVVGGIGWLVPAAIACHNHAFIICGGNGGYNHPSLITSPHMHLERMHFAMPDNFCTCTDKAHDCDKRISDFESQLEGWLLSLAAGD